MMVLQIEFTQIFIILYTKGSDIIPMANNKFINLINLRKKYRISQAKMGEVIGKSRSAYIWKERGATDFYCDEMVKIRDYINARAKVEGDKPVSLEYIFLTK